ncbi:hypothetical protein HBI56_106660 [Parastagonospora nodorum]|uniref:Uncharacterized protein n=2 Tax=Phaeosphaeria nodorum (strain SN15 / ATCC MYA-4574 / FGSC 10173) TaxID=321614 RepID=A0A7U2FD51_PHANO|nr:hypothetical protein SNOG_11558 [Parastagonospora nodorum SN15]KAH3911241.1 hypothetical protein HBH56_132220 [Parastagonospora nodorum]EAT81266.2 hypothetical protein SNOG_11558 [Parastagonospora nodorum SN15]KAH3926943.1 hypothetical protein HBH54_161000 [Parastagonospora nodorum]KAH3949351.1 hypothetical protein HBH53_087180 [Parastagonospora nodorum]KAH3974863.1 hypothetical protein HBH52_134310 [Parastagonospora nodorum]
MKFTTITTTLIALLTSTTLAKLESAEERCQFCAYLDARQCYKHSVEECRDFGRYRCWQKVAECGRKAKCIEEKGHAVCVA